MENVQNVEPVSGYKFDILLFFLIPTGVLALLNIATLIPYIGFIFQLFYFIIVIIIFLIIGIRGREFAEKNLNKKLVVGIVFLVCSFTFIMQYVIGF